MSSRKPKAQLKKMHQILWRQPIRRKCKQQQQQPQRKRKRQKAELLRGAKDVPIPKRQSNERERFRRELPAQLVHPQHA